MAEERQVVREVIARLPQKPLLAGRVTLQLVAWDDPEAPTVLTATRSPQEDVLRSKPSPAECDVTLVILWSRLGTPLPPEIGQSDGSSFPSGTAWECEDALQAQKEVLVYRRTEVPKAELADPNFEEKKRQYQAVLEFFARFRNEDGSLRAGANEYPDPKALAPLLDKHLEMLIRQRLEAGAGRQEDRSSSLRVPVDRPALGHLPRLDTEPLERAFVGRERLLEDLSDACRGLPCPRTFTRKDQGDDLGWGGQPGSPS